MMGLGDLLGETAEVASYAAAAAIVLGSAAAQVRALGRSSRSSAAARGPAREIHVGIPRNGYAGLFGLARAKGLFETAGVSVEVVDFASGYEALGAMLSGNVDLAVAGDLPIAAAATRRSDFVVLAALGRSSFDRWLVTRPNLCTAQDLRGARIATQETSGQHYVLCASLERWGLKRSDVRVVDVRRGEKMPRMLAAGEIDAFVAIRPYAGRAADAFGGELESIPSEGAYPMTLALAARRKVVQERPESVERLLTQLARAAATWAREPEEARRLAAADLGFGLDGAATLMTFEVAIDPKWAERLHEIRAWFSDEYRRQGKRVSSGPELVDRERLRAACPAVLQP